MKQKESINLLKKAVQKSDIPQFWADLGCGSGIFTNALAQLLPNGSHIYAVDRMEQHLPKLMGDNVSISFLKADFGNPDFNLPNLNGILMANSLHYVKNKQVLIKQLEQYLSEEKRFLIVEYDTEVANQWIPYPISFLNLKELFGRAGYANIVKLGEQQSIFRNENLYVADISINLEKI